MTDLFFSTLLFGLMPIFGILIFIDLIKIFIDYVIFSRIFEKSNKPRWLAMV